MKQRFSDNVARFSRLPGVCLIVGLILAGSNVRAEEDATLPGSCCLDDLTCRVTSAQACDLLGGYFRGEGSDCDANPCNDAPLCLLSPTTIDFGPVSVSQFRDRNFRITNTGGRFLSGVMSEACVEFSFVGTRDYELGPAQSKTFTIRYSPQREGESSCGFFLDGGCSELIAVGTGESAPRCDISPESLDFGPVTIDVGGDLPFTVTNNGGGVLDGNVTVPCADFFLVGPSGYNLTSGQSQEFVLRFLPVEVGERSCFVELDGCEPFRVTALGELAPECIFTPSPLLFGTTFVGESSSQDFTLTNGGGGVLEGELGLACQDFRLLGDTTYSLAPGDTAFYSLVFEPERLGGQLCEVQAELPCDPLSAVGHGAIGPQCVLSFNEFDYGIVYLGESSVHELTITNEGGAVLEGRLQFDCGAFSVLGSPDFQLAAGESTGFSVEFAPQSPGQKSCTIVPGERCETVSLVGTAEAPPLCSISQESFSFGEIPLRKVARDSVVVTNLGDGILAGLARLDCVDSGVILIGETSYSLAAGESATIRIEVQPTEPGEIQCTLLLSDRCDTIAIFALGIEEPECQIIPQDLSFGAVPIGLTGDTLIVVTNVGSGVLTGQPQASSPGFVLEGPSEIRLAAGEFEVYQLRFAPSEEAAVQCEIQFGDSCGTWLADGEGLGPVCGLEPSALDFGVVIPGKVVTQAVVVSNRGGGTLEGTLSWDCAAYTVDDQDSGSAIPYRLEAGESDTFHVQFAPLAPSPDNCRISIGATGRDCADLELFGSGGDPLLCDLTPAEIDMVVELGVRTVASAVVTNRGQGRLQGAPVSDCEILRVLSPVDFSLTENESARIEFSITATKLGSFACEIDLGSLCAPLVVDVSVVARRGACCFLDGSCGIRNEAECAAAQGTSWDPESRCEVSSCQPQGACCLIDGGCRLGTADSCPPGTGNYLGDGLSCSPDPCPTAGACCLQSGECIVTTSERCDDRAGFWSVDADCDPASCAPLGACCLIDETCIFVASADCEGAEGFFLGTQSVCLPAPCDPVGACCSANGECRVVSQAVCQSELGLQWTEGTSCGDVFCDPRGACCLDNGACILSTEVSCPGRYQGSGTVCSVSVCRQIGACCDPQGDCTVALESNCEGTFLGVQVACEPSPCRSRVQSVQIIRSDVETVFAVETDDPRIEDLQGWLRRGGESTFSKIQSFQQDGRQWNSPLASANYSIRGLEYYLQYVDVQLGLIVFHGSALDPRRIVLRDEVQAPFARATRFLFLSLPAEIEAPGFGHWLRERFGHAGRTSWRLGWWDPATERYFEHADDLPLPDGVGRGYWLAFADDTDWVFPARTRYPAEDDDSFGIPLSPGWNMIGNPAAYSISVAEEDALIEDRDLLLSLADARPHRVGELLVPESTASAAGPLFPYRTERVSLEMWEGGWIENRTDHEIILRLPALEATPQAGRTSSAAGPGEVVLPTVRFIAEAGAQTAGIDLILDAEAVFGLDSGDIAAPPTGPGRSLELSWSTPERPLLRHAIPDLEERSPIFRITADEPITLSWAVNVDLALELINLSAAGPAIDLNVVRSLRLPVGRHEFRLVARDHPETPAALQSGRVSIEPNPVHHSTRILLDLVRSGMVRMDLFNPAGKRVWSEERGLLTAGRHIFYWDGRGEGGNLLPAGTYFVSIEVDGERTTQKLVLVR